MRQTAAQKELLATARARWALARDATVEQCRRERDDLAFHAGEQWPADIANLRQGQAASNGMPAVPARPTLTINKVREPVRQVQNQERQSDIGISLIPADDFGDLGITPDDTEVKLREGLIRRIQRESHAADARSWAFQRATIAGRGYYLVLTRYLPGVTWDQEVYVHRIFNQADVMLDPSHEQPDGSDAEWGFVGAWIPWDRYRAKYPQTASDGPSEATAEADFTTGLDEFPDWFMADGDERAVREVDYWFVTHTTQTLARLPDGQVVPEAEVPEGVKPEDTRTMDSRTVRMVKIGGGRDILEETDWPSGDLPIIQVLGEELQPFDGERRVEGMVRPARDAAMGFNYMVSKEVEQIGLTPIPPLHVDPVAIHGYEQWYQAANTRTLPYLPSRTYDDDGRPLKEPHRPAIDPNLLPIAQAIGMFDAAIKSTTSVPDSTLGNVDPSLKSGRAIQAVVANAAQSTSNFMDNLARSVRREGEVENNLLYPIYGRPGRIVRILTGEDKQQSMRIAGDGPESMPGQMPRPGGQQQAPVAATVKLTKDAHFNVAVLVSKNYGTRQQEISATLGNIVAAQPQQMGIVGDLLYKSLNLPDSAQLEKRMKVMLAPPVQQMLAQESEGGEPLPPQAQAKIAELTERVQHAEAAMKQLQGLADKTQADQQTKLQIAQIEADVALKRETLQAQADLAKAQLDNQTRFQIAELQAQTAQADQIRKAQESAAQMAHEDIQAAVDLAQESRLTAHADAHADAMAGVA